VLVACIYCGCVCNGSGDQVEFGRGSGTCCGCEGEGAVPPDSGGLGLLPKIAESMEYSRLAASEPNVKLVSNDTLKRGSCD